MKNKVVFITGSASGIGFEMAKQFSHEGAIVVVSDLKNDQIEWAVDFLQETNGNTWGIPCDVTREEDVQFKGTTEAAIFWATCTIIA